LQGEELRRRLEERLAIGRRRPHPAVPGVLADHVDRVQVHERQGRQLAQLTSTAFSRWYDAKKSAAAITRDPSITTPATTTTN